MEKTGRQGGKKQGQERWGRDKCAKGQGTQAGEERAHEIAPHKWESVPLAQDTAIR